MNTNLPASTSLHNTRATMWRQLIACACLVMLAATARGATTYTWNVASGNWGTAASWSPTRTTPAADDVLVFDGSVQATPTVTAVPRETVGRLRFISGSAATITSGTPVAGAGTIARAGTAVTGSGTAFTTFFAVGDFLFTGTNGNVSRITAIASDTALTTAESGTIAAATAYTRATVVKITGNEPGLEVASGSSLNVSNVTPVMITLQPGASGSVSGAVIFSGCAHKLWAIDAGSLTFQNGSSMRADPGFTGNAFGTVNLNSVIFASGSTYIYNANGSGNPFGAGAPSAVAVFQTGSLYSHRIQTSGPAFSGRTYANFEYNNAVSETQLTVTGGGGVNVNDVTVLDGVFGFGMTVTASIKGNVSVASGATLNFNPSAATVLTFNGASPQTISGAGTLSFNANEQLSVASSSTVSLARNITIGNTLTVNGTFNCAANTVTGTATVASGGTLKGTGAVTGVVTVNSGGTVSPGSSIGTLTLGAAPALGGTLLMEITSPSSADKLNVTSGTVIFGGTLTVTNIGGGLANGNTFDLFDGTLSGSFSTLNLPGGPGHWNTTALSTSGEITFHNNAPSATNFGLGVGVGGSTTATVIGKFAPALDADSEVVTITAVSTPTSGTATIIGGTNITYTSTAAAGSDSFTYTVSDGLSTATATVTVTISSPEGFNKLSGPTPTGNPGEYQLNYLGIPGQQYALDETSSLTPPITWMPLVTNTAAGNGALNFTVTPANPSGFFRTRSVP